MGLPYPGGPNLEKMAGQCTNPDAALKRFPLPTPLKGRAGCDFSFSGLKTAVRNHVEKLPEGDLDPRDIADLSYAFQITVGAIIKNRCISAIENFLSTYSKRRKPPSMVVCGGVAANIHIRKTLEDLTRSYNMDFIAPPLPLCSDNGAMIAWVGIEKLKNNIIDTLDIAARPRWPLDPDAEKIRRQ
jgi:N6-L-threonylcarbamoyladenine synthase